MVGLWLSACYPAVPFSMLFNPNQKAVSRPTLSPCRYPPPTPPPPHWAHPALIEHVVQKPPVPGITLDPSYSPSLPPTDWETRWEGMA